MPFQAQEERGLKTGLIAVTFRSMGHPLDSIDVDEHLPDCKAIMRAVRDSKNSDWVLGEDDESGEKALSLRRNLLVTIRPLAPGKDGQYSVFYGEQEIGTVNEDFVKRVLEAQSPAAVAASRHAQFTQFGR